MPARILPDSVHDSMTNPFAHYRAWWNHLDMHSSLKMSMNWACSPSVKNWYIKMWAKSLRSKPHLPSRWNIRFELHCNRKDIHWRNQILGERPDVVQGVFILGENPQCQFVIIHVETAYSYTIFFKRRISPQFSSISDRPCRPKRLQSLAAKTNASKKRCCHVRWNKTQAQTHAHTPHTTTPESVRTMSYQSPQGCQ